MILMVNWIYNVKIKNFTEALVVFKKAKTLDKTFEYSDVIDYWLTQISIWEK
jgi:hypothetical protein